ncbi:MAG: hypothetical protein AB1724_09545 [Thermodesulfobacteriota bacterium]
MKIFIRLLFILLILPVTCVFAAGNAEITYINRWPTAAPNVMTKVGNYVIYGDGECISIYDTTADPALTLVAKVSIHLTEKENLVDSQVSGTEGISGVFYAGGFLYVACGNEGLQIYELPADLTTFSADNLKGTYLVLKEDGRAVVRDVVVSGSLAYIGYYWLTEEGYDSGLQVIDVSDPANPLMAGQAELPPTFADLKRVQSLTLAGDYVYVADLYNGMVVFDISNPATPEIEAVCYIPSALDVAVSGNYAYLVCAGYGLQVVNINPETFTPERDSLPIVAYCQYDGSLTKAISVEVSANYAYIGDVDLGLLVADISSPEDINNNSLVGQYFNDAQGTYRLYLDSANQTVYVGDCRKGLQKVDVSNPASLNFLAGVNDTGTPADAEAVFVDAASSYVFAVDDDPSSGGMSEGVRIFFAVVSEDYVTFLLKGMFPTNGEASDIYYLNGYLFVADGSAGLKIIDPGLSADTAGPVNPVLKGSCPITGGNANGVFVIDGYAYVASGTGGLKVVDVSDPALPTVVGEIAGTDVSDARKVIVRADYAFVADGWNGLKVVDISDKSRPVLTGQYYIEDGDDLDDIPGCAYDVSIVGTLAYVAAGNEGFYILNVLDTTNPSWLANYSAQPYEQVQSIYAARSDVSEGVDLIWMANGTMPDENMGFFIKPATVPPQRSGAYHSAGEVKDIFVVGDYSYIADGAGGFQALTVYEGGGDDEDPSWDDDVVPVNIHHNGKDSGCFVGTLFSSVTDTILRWISKVH